MLENSIKKERLKDVNLETYFEFEFKFEFIKVEYENEYSLNVTCLKIKILFARGLKHL